MLITTWTCSRLVMLHWLLNTISWMSLSPIIRLLPLILLLPKVCFTPETLHSILSGTFFQSFAMLTIVSASKIPNPKLKLMRKQCRSFMFCHYINLTEDYMKDQLHFPSNLNSEQMLLHQWNLTWELTGDSTPDIDQTWYKPWHWTRTGAWQYQ